jgi:PAS domain S-box-containing protein
MTSDMNDRALRSLIECNGEASVYCLDRGYRYLMFNEKHRNEMRKLWGVEIEEGSSILDCTRNPRIGAALKSSFDRVLAGKGIREFLDQNAAHSYEFLGTPILAEDGETIALLAIVFDLGESRAAERKLRESEAKYRRLHESMSEAVVQVEMSGRLVEFNEAYRSLLGYGAEELQGLSYIDITPERWHEMESTIVENQVLVRGYSDVYEKEYRRKDGSLVPIELRTYLLRDEEDRPSGMWAIIRDISDRKRLEAKMNEYKEELERQVAERTRQFEATNIELEAFAYSLSHDLKAPLRAIAGFSAILLDEYAGDLDAEARRLLGVVRGNVTRMEALISGILQMSRVGRAELSMARIDMKAMAYSMYCEKASPEEMANYAFSLAELPDAEGDSSMMRMVWGNLLSNALKFSSRSGRREIRVDSEASEAEIRYRVSDSGVGFDMTYAGKLFKMFQRLHSLGEYDGAGVGLATVKRIVERHGGRVGAQGLVGGGATFWFSLPARARGAEGDAR